MPFYRLAATFLFLLPFQAQAASPLSLEPEALEIVLPPGGSGTYPVRVRGGAGEIRPQTVGYTLDLEGRYRLGGSSPLCPWLRLPPAFPAREEGVEFPLRIELPPEAAGSLWCGVRLPYQGGSGEGLLLQLARLLPVVVTVQGTERPGLRVVAMGREGDGYGVLLENPGNVLLRPQGLVRFLDREGRSVGEAQVEPFPLLPGGRRRIHLPGQPPPGGRALLLLRHAWGQVAAEGR